MLSETRLDGDWKNFCWLCEWRMQCHSELPCVHFHPPDWIDFQVAELVDDHDLRQKEYLSVIAEMRGEA